MSPQIMDGSQGIRSQGTGSNGRRLQTNEAIDNSFNYIPFCSQLICPHCRNTYDRSKMVYSLNIRQYTCLMCRNNILRTV
jgi:hypothetical protein